jgi:peptidoglycan-N-acetylglucosamine deacetylase
MRCSRSSLGTFNPRSLPDRRREVMRRSALPPLHRVVTCTRALLIAVPLSWLLALPPAVALTELAVTIDDLPTHGEAPPGMTRLEIAERMIRSLQSRGIHGVYGFVNGGQVHAYPKHREILEAWAAAGFRLANHTYSHLNLDSVTAQQFIEDIEANESWVALPGRGPVPKLFRYPYLREGNTLEKRNTIRRWLVAHNYRIAPVTVYFKDWAWNDPYARCRSKNDQPAIAWLKESFLKAAADRLAWSDAAARQIFGRPIRQILLLHIGAFDSVMLDELLDAYAAAGVRAIGLEEALRDPAYAADPQLVSGDELTLLEQLGRARRVKLPPGLAPIPERLLETVCR